MDSVVSLLAGLLGGAIAVYARSAFVDVAHFNRMRGFVLAIVCVAAGFCIAWSAAVMASRSAVDAFWQSLPPGHWVDWGGLIDTVKDGAISSWVIASAGISVIAMHGLCMVVEAKGAVGVVAPVQSELVRSRLLLRSRGFALAGACVICASCIGWNVGVDKAHGVLSAYLKNSRAESWVDWLKIGSDILQCAAPWWLLGTIVLAAVALHILGLVADRNSVGHRGDGPESRIIVASTYYSRRP